MLDQICSKFWKFSHCIRNSRNIIPKSIKHSASNTSPFIWSYTKKYFYFSNYNNVMPAFRAHRKNSQVRNTTNNRTNCVIGWPVTV